jgi:thioredoxin 1
MAGQAMEITDSNFEDTILNAGKPALVDFWAVWCGPCRVIGPMVEELAEEYGDRVVVGKLDVDANRDTAVKYGIQAIPTLLLVNNGEIADRIVGVTDKASLTSKLESLLSLISRHPAYEARDMRLTAAKFRSDSLPQSVVVAPWITR